VTGPAGGAGDGGRDTTHRRTNRGGERLFGQAGLLLAAVALSRLAAGRGAAEHAPEAAARLGEEHHRDLTADGEVSTARVPLHVGDGAIQTQSRDVMTADLALRVGVELGGLGEGRDATQDVEVARDLSPHGGPEHLVAVAGPVGHVAEHDDVVHGGPVHAAGARHDVDGGVETPATAIGRFEVVGRVGSAGSDSVRMERSTCIRTAAE